ncbi:OmpA family protein [Shewanella corallii]|uniref:OmpA family protein n=1 Tax=Shewanella corallii TaxID=560080 RepID=A0ABT0N9L2_9GAMM|nr:OmpA family protein [Shewanella corallii]MCL2915060.1 OmpA family protein [Shewanella corallii]
MLLINFAHAEPTRYQTPLEQVKWQFNGDAFGCELSQEITGFGRLALRMEPGVRPALQLDADWLSNAGTTTASVVDSSWNTNTRPQIYTEMFWHQHRAQAKGSVLEPFIEALEQGYSWQLDIRQSDKLSYRLTIPPVNVSESLQAFRQCRRALLPQPFEYVRQREIRFGTSSSLLSADAEQDLRAIARYVKADGNITGVLVDGHADASGNRLSNLVLSQERAENVASRLIELGIDANKLQVFHHGNRKPIASDSSENGRVLNRRVTIRLVKAIGEEEQ